MYSGSKHGMGAAVGEERSCVLLSIGLAVTAGEARRK